MQITDLSLQIAQRILLNKLDWHIQPGQCWSVLGRNGAGKSTLLKTLAGLRAPQAGTIALQGRAYADWSLLELAKLRAYLPQHRIDAFSYTVLETVLASRHPYFGEQYWESDTDLQIAETALRDMDVMALAQRDVRSLSGGERQRVAIASLLAQDATWMLLDEPASALDLPHQVSVMQIFSQLCQQHDKAVVMVSHDLNMAYRNASHALLLMGDGSWLSGTVAQVMTEEKLSLCLGYPIRAFACAGQTIFLPEALK